jgi:ABC-type sugar transport system ATPase subunit
MSKVHEISYAQDDARTLCGRNVQEHLTGRLFLAGKQVLIIADPRSGDIDVTCIKCLAAQDQPHD